VVLAVAADRVVEMASAASAGVMVAVTGVVTALSGRVHRTPFGNGLR
jgi:hypothetical protein